MATLFEISEELTRVYSLIQDDGEIGEEIEKWLATLQEQEAEKLDGYIHLIRRLELEASVAKAEADQYAEEANRFAMRAQTRESKIKQLKNHMKLHLFETGRDRAETKSGRVLRVQKNGGKLAPDIDPVDPEKLPSQFEKFIRVVKTLDRDAIEEALVQGQELPFARFPERGTHLRIT